MPARIWYVTTCRLIGGQCYIDHVGSDGPFSRAQPPCIQDFERKLSTFNITCLSLLSFYCTFTFSHVFLHFLFSFLFFKSSSQFSRLILIGSFVLIGSLTGRQRSEGLDHGGIAPGGCSHLSGLVNQRVSLRRLTAKAVKSSRLYGTGGTW